MVDIPSIYHDNYILEGCDNMYDIGKSPAVYPHPFIAKFEIILYFPTYNLFVFLMVIIRCID